MGGGEVLQREMQKKQKQISMNYGLVFPHQLFEKQPLLDEVKKIFLVEETLFFKQYLFHKQKLVLHRASMKQYADYLKNLSVEVIYIEATDPRSDIRQLISYLHDNEKGVLHFIDPTDDWLEKRISQSCSALDMTIFRHSSPLFLNTSNENREYFSDKKRMFQTDYYIHQRKKKKILIDENNQPAGGKWSFDAENRKKYPARQLPPTLPTISTNDYWKEAVKYVHLNFSHHYGETNGSWIYPTNFSDSRKWLHDFLQQRFAGFGDFEDAIVKNENILHHSVLTPMMNIGLISPDEVIDATLNYSLKNNISLNTTEGFIRQVIGWREFIRSVYELKGKEERTCNFWKFKKKIPEAFWNGTTGILPVDTTIKKVLQTGYCHHIERLMVLGNFMLLCEFDPDEVYRWFMCLFVDAYDWVMVPNVYGMSQFADGGIMATKPYISGSNYLMKMSDYEKGDWQLIWDALFWRFMHVHRDFFMKNPRLGMLVKTFDKMSDDKKANLLSIANQYLKQLDD